MSEAEVVCILIASAVSFAVGIAAAWELDARMRSRRRRGGLYGKDWGRR